MTIVGIISAIAAIVSLRYVSFGVCFLLATKCIVAIPMEYSAVSLGIGVIAGPDLVMLALFLRVMFGFITGKIPFKHVFPVVFLIIFISFSAVYAYVFDHHKLVAFYRTTIGIASYFGICLTMFLLTEKHRNRVIGFGLLCAIAAIFVQQYLIMTKNTSMLIMFNPYFNNNREMAEILTNAISNGEIPRILPSGILLITMCSGYCLVKAMTSTNIIKVVCYTGLYIICTLFLFTTGTRGFVLVSVLVLIFSLYSIRRVISLSRQIALLPIITLGVASLAITVLNNKLFSTLVSRTLEWQKSGYHDAGLLGRWHQSMNAINYIISTPVGIGVTRPLNLPSTIKAGMWDVHGFLTVGLLGGIPAIFFLLLFLFKLYQSYKETATETDVVACGAAVSYALTLTMLNFTSAFSSGENLLAFCLFAGYILSKRFESEIERYKYQSESTTGAPSNTLRLDSNVVINA